MNMYTIVNAMVIAATAVLAVELFTWIRKGR